ncbi:unnamed protein product [Periconia digitata]|uniref:Uncharacterized protein n=1 Tax=Periconia digitata TaxID=1303443 RepID=A0A9W4ULG3_9PLEO|nr:unnamed protein product [Periconia digitata]
MSSRKLRQALQPIRPKRPAEDLILDEQPLHLLTADSLNNTPPDDGQQQEPSKQAHAMESSYDVEPADPDEPPSNQASLPPASNVFTPTVAESNHTEPAETMQFNSIPHQWPSQLASSNSTMWLLPPYTDQSTAIACLLKTEIQSHNITKEMLHNTEQRRLDAARQCERLQTDVNAFSMAYNNASASLQKCAEEFARLCEDYARVSSENLKLRDSNLYQQQTHHHAQSPSSSITLREGESEMRSKPSSPWLRGSESSYSPEL